MEANKEEFDVTRDDLPMPSLQGHIWKQFGNKIECQSCNNRHAAFLQPGYYISGYKDGIPVISQITTRRSDIHPSDGESESTS